MRALTATFAIAAAAATGYAGMASDTADDAAYDSGWNDASNGGTGFGGWSFAEDSFGSGFAGRFLQGPGGGASNVINGSGRAWALFANNGAGREASVAFRGINLAGLGNAGTSLTITMENGGIDAGGRVGLALRSGNANASVDDATTGALTQFYFLGGQANYLVEDGIGLTATGAGFTFDGVRLRFLFTGNGGYDLEIDRFFNETGDFDTIFVNGLQLDGTGTIDSIALFNDDASDGGGNNDIYFNNLEVVVPTPAGALAIGAMGLLTASRRRRA